MRVLICGPIGAVAAAAAWLGLENVLHRDIGWLMIVVGLVTGWCVYKAAGEVVGAGYLRGGFAALVALAAIVGGRQLNAKVLEVVYESTHGVSVVKVTDVVDEDSTTDNSGDTVTDEQADEEEVLLDPDGLVIGKSGKSKASLRKRTSQLEMVWICIAALAAYVIGKGPDRVIEMEDEQAAKQSSDNSNEPAQD